MGIQMSVVVRRFSQKIWTNSLSIKVNNPKAVTLLIVLLLAFPYTSCAKSERGGNSDLSQVSCVDVVELDEIDRDNVISLLHGFTFGKMGVTTFNSADMGKASAIFIEYCRNHPKERALPVMEKIHSGGETSQRQEQHRKGSRDLGKRHSRNIPAAVPGASFQGTQSIEDTSGSVRAFPTAVGYGSKSVGGRGGKIIYVTTLKDNWSPGSLRYALYKASGPRIVIFRVAGLIELKEPRRSRSKDISIVNPYVTVAGQTAPGGGVCIKNGGIAIKTHDVIIRHLCIRPGDSRQGTNPEDRDAIKIARGYNIVLDHISASWAIDETISTWFQKGSPPPRDITIQNSIMSEGLYKSLHPKGLHSRGLLIGDHSTNVTVFQNILAHNNRRNPLVKGDTKNIEIINNVVYNWGRNKGFGTHFSDIERRGPTLAKIINNYYIKGPNSGENYFYFDRLNKKSRMLVKGNSGDIKESRYRIKSKFPMVVDGTYSNKNVPMKKIKNTLNSILQNAGAFVPVRDKVDQRIINDVKNRTGKIINSVSEVGGYPKIRAGTPYRDSDKDGISDKWEKRHNLNPNDSSDSNRKSGTSGYTNIEVFLNELAGD
jgi:pectate lyase